MLPQFEHNLTTPPVSPLSTPSSYPPAIALYLSPLATPIPYSSGLVLRLEGCGLRVQRCLHISIPYSSGLLFGPGRRYHDSGSNHCVAIPYSSGLLFGRLRNRPRYPLRRLRRNPLFVGTPFRTRRLRRRKRKEARVAIPYSSGLLFGQVL